MLTKEYLTVMMPVRYLYLYGREGSRSHATGAFSRDAGSGRTRFPNGHSGDSGEAVQPAAAQFDRQPGALVIGRSGRGHPAAGIRDGSGPGVRGGGPAAGELVIIRLYLADEHTAPRDRGAWSRPH